MAGSRATLPVELLRSILGLLAWRPILKLVSV
jgi:hypothetical protein